MKHSTDEERIRLTKAVWKVIEISDSLRDARLSFVMEVSEVMKRIGILESESDYEDSIILDVPDDFAPDGMALFRKMEWTAEKGVVVSAISVSDMKTQIEIPLEEIGNSEVLCNLI